MISKNNVRLNITLDKSSANLLEALSKESKKTKSEIVKIGIGLVFTALTSDINFKEPTEKKGVSK